MLSKNELRYMLALQRVPNLGDTSAKKLLQYVGSAEGVFKEKKEKLLKIDGIGAFKLKDLYRSQQLDEAETELRFIEKNDIDCCSFHDANYPDNLKQCLDAPILLFSKGNIDLKNKRIISIVGTRNVTPQGIRSCEELIAGLAPLNPVIVSGFAYGVDVTAHKAAMENGLQTIVCFAHGLNLVYPKTHKKYVSAVKENGGLLTEFWSSDSFDRTNFLRRNRIIAGLSEATIIIESAEKGGSLVTADIANSYNREVFAIPGRVTDRQSKGCNDLIKTQQAHLLGGAADLIYLLGWEMKERIPNETQTQLFITFTEDEKTIWEFLKKQDKELLDIIAIECRMPTHRVATLLLNMELKGAIQPLPGKLFQVI